MGGLVKDHPRSRGVYAELPPGRAWVLGSSPLARGLRGAGGEQHRRDGIIPARAGFTAPVVKEGRVAGDHPRSRGVYTGESGSRPKIGGSSPLARGLPRRGSWT